MAPRVIDPRIKLRHIACFLEVARLRSVIHAASALNISQPAVSKTIQELEESLGSALFDRSRRRLALTAFGETFFNYASTSMVALRQGIDAARGGGDAAMVKVGALPTVSARILPAAVQGFTTNNPGIHARIITGPNNYLLSQLRTGDVDLVIGRMAEPDMMMGLNFEPLYSEQVLLVVRPGHALLEKRDFDIAAVQSCQVLMPTPDAAIRHHVERMLLAQGVTRIRDEIETVSNAFGRAYVRQSDAIWIISEGVVADDIRDGYLAALPVDTSQTLGPVGFTCRTDTPQGTACLAFMSAVREVATGLRAQHL